MTELAAERAAHAATREELRRAREALRDALSWCETLAGECISAGLDDDDEIKRMIGDVRAKRDALSSAPASSSTEAAVEAGIEAAVAYVHDQEMRGLARQIRECVDPAAIARGLEGR